MSCLAIVLNGPKTTNGRRVFDSFKCANQKCIWNRDLALAADSLIYMGFLRPQTLFVSAPGDHLQSLKSAWVRRTLKAAEGYQITSVGNEHRGEFPVYSPAQELQRIPLMHPEDEQGYKEVEDPFSDIGIEPESPSYCPPPSPRNDIEVEQDQEEEEENSYHPVSPSFSPQYRPYEDEEDPEEGSAGKPVQREELAEAAENGQQSLITLRGLGAARTNFPWFANSGSDCSVNSVAWCIRATRTKTSTSNGDPTNPICSFFSSIKMNDNDGLRHSTRPLRELFPSFLENERHRHYDAVDFYAKLVESLPYALAYQMSVERKSYVACMDCQRETLELESRETVLRPTHSREFSEICSQLEPTVMQDNTTMKCTHCGKTTPRMRWLSYDAFGTRVTTVEFPWSVDPSAHVFNRPEEVTLFDEKWRPKGAVKYHAGADWGEVGRYVSIVEEEGEWYLLDDQKRSEERTEFPRNHSMIRMLMFEKI